MPNTRRIVGVTSTIDAFLTLKPGFMPGPFAMKTPSIVWVPFHPVMDAPLVKSLPPPTVASNSHLPSFITNTMSGASPKWGPK